MTPFFQILHPLTPFFTIQSTLNDPFFSKFRCKISIFSRASRAFQNFCQFSAEKRRIFTQILTKFTQNDPIFLEVYTQKKKKKKFWIPHPMTPFFLRNPTPIVPCFCAQVSTYPSLSYSSSLPAQMKNMDEVCFILVFY